MFLLERPVLRIMLAAIWMTLQDSYTVATFAVGLLVATVTLLIFPAPIISFSRPWDGRGLFGFFTWLYRFTLLVGYFILELIKSNWAVIRRVLAINPNLKPGLLAMPLRATKPQQIALLASMITLTPGTLTVEVSADHRVIYIHALDATDQAEALLVPRRFETMIMEVMP